MLSPDGNENIIINFLYYIHKNVRFQKKDIQ